MGIKATLAFLAPAALAACSDLPPYPYTFDAGTDSGADTRGSLCSKNSYDYDPSVSIPPNHWVKQAITIILDHGVYITDPYHTQIQGDIEKARKDLKQRLELSGFKILEEIYEPEVAKASEDAACLTPDLVDVVLKQDPVIDGERKATRKATLFLLRVTTPDGKKARAGLHGQFSQIVGETQSKVSGVIIGLVAPEDDGCATLLGTDLGSPASLAAYELPDGTQGVYGDTYNANVGSFHWQTSPDGTTALSPGQGFHSSKDQCNTDAYRREIADAREYLDLFAKVSP